MWADLEPVGRSASTGGYHRFAWTREDHDLREWFAAECARRGLDLTEDRMGNQWAWWGDPDSAAARGDEGVVTGSHLDSVPDGGAFDGPLGVVSALAALDELRDRGFEPAPPHRGRELRRRGGRPVRRRLRRLPRHHRRHDRRPRPLASPTPTAPPWPRRWQGGRPRPAPDRSATTDALAPHRGLRRAPRRAGPRPRRPRPPGRRRHRHLAARTLAARLPGRGQPRRHHAPRGPPRRDARLRRRRPRRPARPPRPTGASPRSARSPSSPAASTPSPAPSPAGSTPGAPDEASVRAAVSTVEAEAQQRRRHRHRGVLDPHHGLRPPRWARASTPGSAAYRCWAPAPATTPESSPTRAFPPPCSSSATPLASPTRPRSAPRLIRLPRWGRAP